MNFNRKNIAIIGLGYVGLPLALAFSKYFDVIGFDKNVQRVKVLRIEFSAVENLSGPQESTSGIFRCVDVNCGLKEATTKSVYFILNCVFICFPISPRWILIISEMSDPAGVIETWLRVMACLVNIIFFAL